MALSSIEDEYVDATTSACQAVWLRRLLKDIYHKQEHATEVFCDNVSAVALTRNPEICKSSDQLVDILTKPLAPAKFEDLGKDILLLRGMIQRRPS
ncbi:hypothetical protein Tco_0943082 [Tanacetum coccineum]